LGASEAVWHGLLYAQIEFLDSKGIKIPGVSLSKENKDILHKKRNAVFHLQGKYYSKKFFSFYYKTEAQEIQGAHMAIGRFVQAELEKQLKKKPNIIHLKSEDIPDP